MKESVLCIWGRNALKSILSAAKYACIILSLIYLFVSESFMAEIKRNSRNTLERRCLGKAFKRLYARSPKSVFKMLEKVKRA